MGPGNFAVGTVMNLDADTYPLSNLEVRIHGYFHQEQGQKQVGH